MAEVSAELWELASEALDLAVDCFAAGESNPIVLFDDRSGQRPMVDVKDDQSNVTPELVQAARGVVSEGVGTAAQRYAIAFDGYLTTDGERLDAAFVEAGERGSRRRLCLLIKKAVGQGGAAGTCTGRGATAELISCGSPRLT